MVGAKRSWRGAAAPLQRGPQRSWEGVSGRQARRQRAAVSPPPGLLRSPSARPVGGPRLGKNWTGGGIRPLFWHTELGKLLVSAWGAEGAVL